jgi:hypothetical protein
VFEDALTFITDNVWTHSFVTIELYMLMLVYEGGNRPFCSFLLTDKPPMGIARLWPLIEPLGRRGSLKTILAHRRLAIDASVWLHVLARQYARPYILNGETEAIVTGFYNQLVALRSASIDPVVVFDNFIKTPGKAREDQKRQEKRDAALKLILVAKAADEVDHTCAVSTILESKFSISAKI